MVLRNHKTFYLVTTSLFFIVLIEKLESHKMIKKLEVTFITMFVLFYLMLFKETTSTLYQSLFYFP
jgi:hypothetical protein